MQNAPKTISKNNAINMSSPPLLLLFYYILLKCMRLFITLKRSSSYDEKIIEPLPASSNRSHDEMKEVLCSFRNDIYKTPRERRFFPISEGSLVGDGPTGPTI